MGDVSIFERSQIALSVHSLAQYLFSKGIIKQDGTRPLPAEVVDPLGNCKSTIKSSPGWVCLFILSLDSWSLLGGNQFVKPERLYKLGWESTETKRSSLLDSLPDAIEQALKE